MASEINKEIELEFGHVLFIDIVGYSKLSLNQQRAAIEQLNEIVDHPRSFRRAKRMGNN